MMGFDYVCEVAHGADIVSRAIMEKMREPGVPRPLISSSCPAVVRLIQTRFPELIDNIVDVKSPMEVAAIEARRRFCAERGVANEDVGCFFITPCAAKMTAIRNPSGPRHQRGQWRHFLPRGLWRASELLRKGNIKPDLAHFSATSLASTGARTGGEALAIGENEALAVDGIDNVIRVLEEIENNRLPEVRYFEGLACLGGCVGGPLTFENMFIARNRIRLLAQMLPKTRPEQKIRDEELDSLRDAIGFETPLAPFEKHPPGR